MDNVIGILGFGNMGSAIAECLKSEHEVFVFDKEKSRISNTQGLGVANSVEDLLNTADIFILAVKPQDFSTVLKSIKAGIGDKLLISIAAGVTTSAIETSLGKVRLIRVMPNLPARIGKGITCLTKGKYAQDDDLRFAQSLFGALGKTCILQEDLMNAATSISGSGPGYLYDICQARSLQEIEAYASQEFILLLEDAAHALGFSAHEAHELATATTEGSIAFLKASGLSPAELVKQICSKGGTTEAGIAVLRKGGALKEAVYAARARAQELSEKLQFS
ncbi:MAG: pyrroline-5-carboxylate reductase [Candidatus Omnitrophica bacterium]|nr:pyrroline-5-carboxylate reductase [Candidatus Omnitrophota bacterium]